MVDFLPHYVTVFVKSVNMFYCGLRCWTWSTNDTFCTGHVKSAMELCQENVLKTLCSSTYGSYLARKFGTLYVCPPLEQLSFAWRSFPLHNCPPSDLLLHQLAMAPKISSWPSSKWETNSTASLNPANIQNPTKLSLAEVCNPGWCCP